MYLVISAPMANLKPYVLNKTKKCISNSLNISKSQWDVLLDCLLWSRFLPADDAIEHAHYKHGEGEVPGVTHGNEHHIVGIFQVPLGAAGRVQHKTNLWFRGENIGSNYKSANINICS